MSRNIGGSIGIAMLSTIVTQREHLHSVHLGEFVTPIRQPCRRGSISAAAFRIKGIDAGTANGYALAALNRSVQSNAYIMAYSDAFLVIGASLILAIAGSFSCRNRSRAGRCRWSIRAIQRMVRTGHIPW